MNEYFRLMRLDKPIGILLLLCPTLWALWISSNGHPHLNNIFIFMAGVIIMRSAGCVANDITDRRFDLHVARTRNRPIASGKISVRSALFLLTILCFIAFILVCLTNVLTILLSFAALAIALIYPFMKRYTDWPQLFLGCAFSMSILMAYTAETNHLSLSAFVLFFANIAWTIAYDTEYAMTDRQDDVLIGVRSTAILFGCYDRWMIGVFQGIFIVLLACLGIGKIALLIAGLLFGYQHYLMRNRTPTLCFNAFLNNQWVGCLVFLSIL